jgi:outer membrane protein OmpA-like peptidoglycan-associated protein
MLFGARDQVVVDAGVAHGLEPGQKYFVRRSTTVGPPARVTAGWLSIVDVTEQTAIATVDFSCDGILPGDHLEPYAAPELPPGIDRTDSSGALDLAMQAQVLHGDGGRSMGGKGDFMVADRKENDGAAPGARYAIFRDQHLAGIPPVQIGEAVVVSTTADGSLIRLTAARDAVMPGDLLVARKPEPRVEAATTPSAPARPVALRDDPTPASTDVREAVRSYVFDDVYFDFDRYTPRPEAAQVLDEAVEAMQADATLRLQIEGHTCNIGTAEYNLALGDRRARAIVDYLASRGIPATRLTTISYGEERPKHDNAREETRRMNRRAALVVSLSQ